MESEEPVTEITQTMKISRGEKPDTDIDLPHVENVKLYDENGEVMKFGDLYKKQKTIVILIRHFLCFMTKEYVDDLALIPSHFFHNANVRIVVVGCGPWKFVKDFKQATGYNYEIYTDPERNLFRRLGCFDRYKEGVRQTSKHIKSNFLLGVLKSTWRGMAYRENQGDIDQQGGSFIFGPGNEVSHQHYDRSPSDHVPINDLLALAGVQQMNFEKDQRVMTI